MRIALRAPTGYLCAELGGEAEPGRGLVTANRSQIGAWETWTVEQNGDGIALKSCNGFYLSAEGGGGSTLYVNRAQAQGWERFAKPDAPMIDGATVALMTQNGHALLVEDGAEHVVSARAGTLSGTRFRIELIDAEVVTSIRRRVIEGRLFRTDDGALFRYVGWSDFALFRQFVEGGAAAIADIVTERVAIFGVNRVARVFRYAGNNNAFALAPAWDAPRLDLLLAFLRYMGTRGCYVMLTAGDAQFVLPNQADQQREVNAVYEAIENEPNVDFQTCNEDWKNGVDTKIVKPKKGMVLRSSGHYTGPWGDATFEGTMLDFLDYHSVRSGEGPYPKWIWDPPEEMYDAFVNVPIVGGEERGAAEQNDPGRRSNEPRKFFKLAVERVNWDVGVIFHSTAGINSSLFPPTTKACAEDFGRGVRLMEAN